jgi:membrane-bound lytic murein transglycosylase D
LTLSETLWYHRRDAAADADREAGRGESMHVGTLLLIVALSAAAAARPSLAADDAEAAARRAAHVQSRLFPRPATMETQIRFWRSVFATYTVNQVVLHDALHLDKIYKVLDFRRYVEEGMAESEVDDLRRIETDLELARIRATLLRLHGLGPQVDRDSLSSEERSIYDLHKNDRAPDRFLAAADDRRLRSQRGLRERFAEGIRVSRRYLPEMERIFRAEGLPIELTRLPLIESCFNVRANSKVGAAGVWQFMPSTGRLYLRVDDILDERRDPLHSTYAAAAYLRRLHDTLDTWPLAITAYNHGPLGLARAVRYTGTTDIGVIVRQYEGKAFGFASRNFYAEFLAALDIERDWRKHFGNLTPQPPWDAHLHTLPRAVDLETAARLASTGSEELAALNPSFGDPVLGGRRMIPRGARIWLPPSGAEGFESRLLALADSEPPRVVTATARSSKRSRPAAATHRVRAGQTLSHIARQHRVSVDRLRTTNGLARKDRIRVGQVLKIPGAQKTAM